MAEFAIQTFGTTLVRYTPIEERTPDTGWVDVVKFPYGDDDDSMSRDDAHALATRRMDRAEGDPALKGYERRVVERV